MYYEFILWIESFLLILFCNKFHSFWEEKGKRTHSFNGGKLKLWLKSMYFEFILCKGIISFNTFLGLRFHEKGNIADISMVKKTIIDQLILGEVEFSALFALFRKNQVSKGVAWRFKKWALIFCRRRK